MSIKKRMLRAFIIYSLDMGAAILGWIYGFGLQVSNWWALIGIMICWRFVFHILSVCAYVDDAKSIPAKKEPGNV
jgi:hypothetical protein